MDVMQIYWQFVQPYFPESTGATAALGRFEVGNLEEPETALDLNNLAVLSLIEAEAAAEPELRAMSLDMALEALQAGIEQEPGHPLCLAHWAMVQAMIGETGRAIEQAFSEFINLLPLAYDSAAVLPSGLIYIPPLPGAVGAIARGEWFQACLSERDGHQQALMLASAALCQAHLVFYNQPSQRMLQFISSLASEVSHLKLKLGLAKFMSHQWEGLLYLHQAQAQGSDAATHQALFLAYRKLGRSDLATHWLQQGQQSAASSMTPASWDWTTLPLDSPFTYLPLAQDGLMAVEANPLSIVTSVLLAEGDWFESEMEFWRDRLHPGMTVIDVGANVGVYTFSAARQVGPTGKVVAIEPFSGCVRCLQETRRLNQLDWVQVFGAAASDRPGTLRLSIHEASELNEVLADDETPANGQIETVPCITLDDLMTEAQLERVDWLKIDAEGHEMQVLAGGDRLLKQFRPAILYENIAGSHASNTAVGEYLMAQGYQLYRYQPYLKNLIPVKSVQDLQFSLNVIALPSGLEDV